jgi:hypothetical protein
MRPSTVLKLLVPVLALAGLAQPASGGPREQSLLESYVGTWRGASSASGPYAGPIDCSITFRSQSGGKLTYTGDCDIEAAGRTAFRGTIVYNDAARRFETAGSGQGVSVTGFGKSSGNSVTFAVANIDTSYGVASSTMVLAGDAIKLSFSLVDQKGKTAASITFRKG